ncbi:MAG TPA: hypothetical protein DIT98_11130 [Verrucomicrobiales bacterium]|nr:hypothetical protein [Verrucomicrobiales bacterium]
MLLTAFALSGCAEQILDSASEDPTPSITDGEESSTPNGVVAQYSSSTARVPLPNDLIRGAVDSEETPFPGTTPSMPVRIPMSDNVTALPFDHVTSQAQMLAALSWGTNILFINTDNESEPVKYGLPTTDLFGNTINIPYSGDNYTGSFKVIYQDSNHDIVFVPERTTFSDNATYAVVVKKDLKGTDGNPLIEDVLTGLLKSTDNLTDENGVIQSAVLQAQVDAGLSTVSQVQGLELLRQGYSEIYAGLASQGINKSDVAILFTFKTEADDDATTQAITAALIKAYSVVDNATTAASDNVTWDNSTAQVEDNATAFNYQSYFASTTGGLIDDNVTAIYKGYFSCMNFLRDNGTAGWKWDETSIGLTLAGQKPVADCPHKDNLTGRLEFWVAQAATPTGVVIYQHGITRVKEDFVAVANAMAGVGLSTIAVDMWKHGSRAYYEDITGDGLITDLDNSSVDPTFFMRPGPDIGMTVGYMYQTEWDLRRLVAMIQNNAEIYGALGLASAPTAANTFFYGHSLGAMLGANLVSGTLFPTLINQPEIGGYVLAASGGDATDIILNGAFRQEIVDTVVAGDPIKYDNSTVVGAANLNSTISALEMITTHGLFKGFVDPMNRAGEGVTPLLIQQMEGDLTIPNNNTTLLKYGMLTDRYADGAGDQTGVWTSWDYQACRYGLNVTEDASVLHGFTLNWTDTYYATLRSQTQAATFFGSVLLGGSSVIDPSTGLTGTCN